MSDTEQFVLEGRTALVTGGNTGIGLGIASGLAKAGAAVAIVGRTPAKNERALAELAQFHPGCRQFVFDLEETEAIPATYERISAEMQEVAERQQTPTTFTLRHTIAPALCDAIVQGVIDRSAAAIGLSRIHMPSGAGHDAQSLARICPVGMLFVPSVDGVTHSPREYTAPEDVTNGANVLLQSVVALDRR